jgi:hypothetical protein
MARFGLALVCTTVTIAAGVFALSHVRHSTDSPPLREHYDVPADQAPDYYWSC